MRSVLSQNVEPLILNTALRASSDARSPTRSSSALVSAFRVSTRRPMTLSWSSRLREFFTNDLANIVFRLV